MKAAESILLVGAGGHAQACIDVIEAQGIFRIMGLFDSSPVKEARCLGYPVLGSDDELPSFVGDGTSALVCVGQIKSPELRIRLFARLRQLGFALPTIISPRAWVSPHAHIGAGSIVMHGAIVNADANVGENCIINTGAIVEHGARIGDHCHISTRAVLNGDVQVGAGSFIGSGSLLKEGAQVGERCIVGMGVTVFSSVYDGTTVKRAV